MHAVGAAQALVEIRELVWVRVEETFVREVFSLLPIDGEKVAREKGGNDGAVWLLNAWFWVPVAGLCVTFVSAKVVLFGGVWGEFGKVKYRYDCYKEEDNN